MLKNFNFSIVEAVYFQGQLIINSYRHLVRCTFKGGLQLDKYGFLFETVADFMNFVPKI